MANTEIIETLQKQILRLQGGRRSKEEQAGLGLGPMESAFPGKIFPRGAVHELISFLPAEASSTNGFISAVLGKLMGHNGCCLWISSRRKIFPPALKAFGIEPARVLFADAWKVKDGLWAIEEGLKCGALTSVVGELSELSFNDSRRLQLAVEKSGVTGFIHRHQPKAINPVACVSRWKITPAPCSVDGNMPGLGFATWKVELLKVRNGEPGQWLVQWGPQGLTYIEEKVALPKIYELKTA